LKTAIRKERRAQISHADEDDGLEAARAEQIGNHLRELLYIVAQSTRAELAEISQVFAQLRRLDARNFCQGFAGNRANAIRFQALETTQVNRKTIDRLPGNFRAVRFFQGAGELLQSLMAGKHAPFQAAHLAWAA
jgi:hypothetical protein